MCIIIKKNDKYIQNAGDIYCALYKTNEKTNESIVKKI